MVVGCSGLWLYVLCSDSLEEKAEEREKEEEDARCCGVRGEEVRVWVYMGTGLIRNRPPL